jgi:hypothetical protein
MDPVFDEREYLARGRAFAQILSQLGQFESPPASAATAACGDGVWPPLHPLLLGLASSLFGPSACCSRR